MADEAAAAVQGGDGESVDVSAAANAEFAAHQTAPTQTDQVARTMAKAAPRPSLAEQVKTARAAVAQSHSAETFVNKLPMLIMGLKQDLDQALAEQARASEEHARWHKLMHVPGVETATKDATIKPHLDHWKGETERLRGIIGPIERDVKNLQVLADAQATAPTP